MGADLYIEPFFSENRKKYEKLFDEAVATRDRSSKGIPEPAQYARRKKEALGLIIGNGHKPKPTDRLTPAEEALLVTYASDFAIVEELQKKVIDLSDKMYEVGYFRDSYNCSSLFWKLGLSWWAMADGKKINLINRQGNISVKNAKVLLALVKSLPIQITEESINGWEPGTTVASLTEYFEAKKKRFEEFLQFAIDNKRPIQASV